MRVIESYITKEFLSNFIANLINRPSLDLEQRMSNDKFRLLLEKYTKIFIGLSKTDLAKLQETHPALFRFLTNLYLQSQLSLDFKISSFLKDKERLSENSPYKFIFGDFTENEIEEHEKKIGYPVLSIGNFQDKWSKLAQETELTINKGETGEDILEHWKDLGTLKMPIHSIVIADQYLFAHSDNIESNVFKLLRRILPKNDINHSIDITIVTTHIYEKDGQEESLSLLQKKITRYIQNNLLLLNINISIVQKRKEGLTFHDRLIFTNVFVYNSGNSISYFDKNGATRLNNITDFKIIPVTSFAKDKSGSLNSRANYYRKHLRQIHDIIHNLTADDRSVGDKENRLLDWAVGLPQ